MLNYQTFFNIDTKQVENEVRRIIMESREYDDWGRPVNNSADKRV